MSVDLATAAATVAHDGTTYAFCAQSCCARFVADPERFLLGGPVGMEQSPTTISLSRKPRSAD
jgi:YHS domain-containing protein